VSLIDQAGLDIIIETNGTLVDDDLARFLKERRVCFVSVSVDGATAETHDALRRVQGSYERALAGIRALVQAGFLPQLICTLHRGNVSQMEEVVALAERLGCGSVKFNHVQRVGRGERLRGGARVEVAKIIRLYRHLEDELVPSSKIQIHFDIPLPSTRSAHCSAIRWAGVRSGISWACWRVGSCRCVASASPCQNLSTDISRLTICAKCGIIVLS